MIPALAAIAESAPVTPAPSVAVQSATGTPAFDAILMLQNLAATAECLEAANFETGEAPELLAGEDSGDEDEDGEDLEASLAFLSALLTAATPKGSNGDFESGGQSQGGFAEQPPAPAATPRAAPGEPTINLAEPAVAATQADAALALLRAEAEPQALQDDPSQNLARAGEILAQAQRAPGGVDRPTTAMTIATPVRDPRWSEEFGARVSLMVRAGESTASMQMTPVDLGPVEVNVTVREGQAAIHFGASQAETRALLEASLPRLRELLAAQGFTLTDASVSSGFSRSQPQGATPGARAAAESETSSTEARTVRQLGLLDLYA